MGLNIHIETPDHHHLIEQIQARQMNADKMEVVVQEIGRIAEERILDYLQGHVRTGETLSSIRTLTTMKSDAQVTVFVGTSTRGLQLRILDRGRREVYPKHLTRSGKMGWLKWLTPEGVIVFARYSRAVAGSGIMQQAAEFAMTQAQSVIDNAMRLQEYVR